MNDAAPQSVKSKKKKVLGLFGRKKSKSKREENSSDPNPDEDDQEPDENENETDSDEEGGVGSSLMAPGRHYTAPQRSKSGLPPPRRGREVARRNSMSSDAERSVSRSRSRSVSSAFRKLVGGGGGKTKSKSGEDAELLASRSEKNQSPPQENSSSRRLEASNDKYDKKQNKDDDGCDESLTGIEISIHGDDSSGPLLSPATKKKKKASKKKKDRDTDDDTMSRDSGPSVTRKKSRKKKDPADASSPGEKLKKKSKSKKSHKEYDVVDRAMKMRIQRASVHGDLQSAIRQRERRSIMIQEMKKKSSSDRGRGWEDEEYLISPTPGKKKGLETIFDGDNAQGRPSARSLISDRSSQNKSVTDLDDNDSTAALAQTVASLKKKIKRRDHENSDMQKALADALSKVAKLNEDLRRRELESAKAINDFNDVRKELQSVLKQNTKLHESLDVVEKELAVKEDQIDSLEQVVEEQMDRVDGLEKKLEQTEEELFGLEDILKMVEAKGLAEDEESAPQGRLERVKSIRIDRMERMESKKNLIRRESVRNMFPGSLDRSSHNAKATDLASWERKLEEKERQLEVARDRDQTREQRLEEWEAELLEREMKLRTGTESVHLDVLKTRERDVEERERLLKQSQEKLQDNQSNSGRVKFVSEPETEDDKDMLIRDLKAECEDLVAEKEELIRTYEEEEKQRDEDLFIIQEEINERLRALENENEELRLQVEELEEKKAEDSELAITVAKLQTEVAILKKASSVDGNESDVLRALQEEVTQQLVILDEENRKLSDKLVDEQRLLRRKLKEKDSIIDELERKLEDFESPDDPVAKIPGDENIKNQLQAAVQTVREKQEEIELLQKRLYIITDEFQKRNQQAVQAKDTTIKQLEEELIATRAVIEAKTSDQFSMEMKAEIKTLRTAVQNLNKQLKQEQQKARSILQEKENALLKAQRENTRLLQEAERREQREKQRTQSSVPAQDADLQQHIEDLEDEVDHWKKVNYELEDELSHWKNEASELRLKLEVDEANDIDDDGSIVSHTSQLSRQQSKQALFLSRPPLANPEHLNMSQHTLTVKSLTKDDMFFVSDNDVSHTGTETSMIESSSSHRAMRTVTDLWSKMTMKPAPPSTGLYQRSSLED